MNNEEAATVRFGDLKVGSKFVEPGSVNVSERIEFMKTTGKARNAVALNPWTPVRFENDAQVVSVPWVKKD